MWADVAVKCPQMIFSIFHTPEYLLLFLCRVSRSSSVVRTRLAVVPLSPLITQRCQGYRPGNYNWSNGALNNRGTNGNFWSSVGYSSTNAHNLNFNSSNFNPQNGNNKGNGFSVRCVAV